MKNDLILQKTNLIKHSINRVFEVYENNYNTLNDETKQESILLNIQRACEASIYIGMHIVTERRLGLPQNSHDAFQFLQENNIISEDMSSRMRVMVDFRNTIVHNYQSIELDYLHEIIEKHLINFTTFTKCIIKDLSSNENY
ncbi:type VII toxin-antitoxin system HepT family RNase toxin [Cytobacillus sp. IB215665]|uniref:type VII toxin-antitoxin system HepT family RNase toxin n=1 Tax=Cytobacillus sp. IB215665 TaxID=3097357 RepID=UPI002A114C34|nr:DUF86 domain-containing protein [Cytobacillus sp. IB215665]MDX8367211.1 DUF86 domain-containing protein [Cytobacillus sp. IB215665]